MGTDGKNHAKVTEFWGGRERSLVFAAENHFSSSSQKCELFLTCLWRYRQGKETTVCALELVCVGYPRKMSRHGFQTAEISVFHAKKSPISLTLSRKLSLKA